MAKMNYAAIILLTVQLLKQMQTEPCAQGKLVPRGCVKLDQSNIAEICWVNQQGALEKYLDPGR